MLWYLDVGKLIIYKNNICIEHFHNRIGFRPPALKLTRTRTRTEHRKVSKKGNWWTWINDRWFIHKCYSKWQIVYILTHSKFLAKQNRLPFQLVHHWFAQFARSINQFNWVEVIQSRFEDFFSSPFSTMLPLSFAGLFCLPLSIEVLNCSVFFALRKSFSFGDLHSFFCSFIGWTDKKGNRQKIISTQFLPQ